MKISYIINHKSNSKERSSNLNFVCKWIKNKFKDLELIVVEQTPSIKIDDLTLNYIDKLISFENKSQFKRSLGFNIGYKNCNLDSEIFIFGDNDIIFSSESFFECLKFTESTKGTASPYKEILNLERGCEKNIHPDKEIIFDYINENIRGGYAGGVIFVHKKSFEKVGGWDERFIGWGGEDNHFEEKLKNLNVPMFSFEKYPAYHLYHEVSDNSTNPFYENNLKLFNEIKSLSSKETKSFCHNKINTIGNVNFIKIK